MKKYFTYILLCSDKSYYTGMTSEIEKRMREHHTGYYKSCYTYDRRPLELVFLEVSNDPNQAIALENQIKGWSRKKKQALIHENWSKLKELAACHNITSAENYNKVLISGKDNS